MTNEPDPIKEWTAEFQLPPRNKVTQTMIDILAIGLLAMLVIIGGIIGFVFFLQLIILILGHR